MKHLRQHMLYAFIISAILTTRATMAITHKSVASGNWNTASTWNDPSVPKCGDSIIIQAGHIISLTNQTASLNQCMGLQAKDVRGNANDHTSS